MALPALDAVRRSLPQAALTVLAKPWVADVVELSGLADETILYRAPGGQTGLLGKVSLARFLRRRGFDGVILLPNAFAAAFLAAAAGIPLRAGYASDGRGFLLTHRVPPTPGNWPRRHQVGYYLDLVRTLGFSAPVEEVSSLRMPGMAGSVRGRVVFSPGASFGPAKMWPVERWIELGRRLVGRGCHLVILGSAAEAATGSRMAQGVGLGAEDRSGRTTLREAAVVLAGAVVVVSNDSGLMHLAAAVGARLVALFGSTDPVATGPLSVSSVVIRGTAPCAPCFRRECNRREGNMACFDEVTVDQVEAACLEALERGKP